MSLPTRNSTLRMRVWRALKDAGCGVLRDGVYLLPAKADGSVLEKMESEIGTGGGFAMTVDLAPRDARHRQAIEKLFDRTADYGSLVREVADAKGALRRLGQAKARAMVQRLGRTFEDIARIDFFPGAPKREAAAALAELQRHAEDLYAEREPSPARKKVRLLDRSKYRKRVWATRAAPWVDRLASAWLIKRYIDRDARFLWLKHPRDCPRSALGFDFDGATFTHVDDKVTFEVLAASFGLQDDPAVAAIGASVHFLDVGGIPVPDAKGLETLLTGVKEKSRNDDALLAEAMRIFDLLHSAYASKAAA